MKAAGLGVISLASSCLIHNHQLCAPTIAAIKCRGRDHIGGSSVSSDQEFLTEGDGVMGSPLRQPAMRPPIGPRLGTMLGS